MATKPTPIFTKPPIDLNPIAAERWAEVLRILERQGALSGVDLGQLRRYCWLYARWVDLSTWIDAHGTTHAVRDADGKPVGAANWPQVNTIIQIEAQLARLEERLGLATSTAAESTARPGAFVPPGV